MPSARPARIMFTQHRTAMEPEHVCAVMALFPRRRTDRSGRSAADDGHGLDVDGMHAASVQKEGRWIRSGPSMFGHTHGPVAPKRWTSSVGRAPTPPISTRCGRASFPVASGMHPARRVRSSEARPWYVGSGTMIVVVAALIVHIVLRNAAQATP